MAATDRLDPTDRLGKIDEVRGPSRQIDAQLMVVDRGPRCPQRVKEISGVGRGRQISEGMCQRDLDLGDVVELVASERRQQSRDPRRQATANYGGRAGGARPFVEVRYGAPGCVVVTERDIG